MFLNVFIASVWQLIYILCSFMAGIGIHIHVTPYQVHDERRPWIRKEEKAFGDLLRRLGAPVHRTLHFENQVASLYTHFEVLNAFRQTSKWAVSLLSTQKCWGEANFLTTSIMWLTLPYGKFPLVHRSSKCILQDAVAFLIDQVCLVTSGLYLYTVIHFLSETCIRKIKMNTALKVLTLSAFQRELL